MKYKKVIEDVLKSYYKPIDPRCPMIGEYENKIGVSSDGNYLVLLPKSEFILDKDKLLRNKPEFNVKRMCESYDWDEIESVSLTGEMTKVDKQTVVRVGHKWIREKYLKYFDNPIFGTPKNYPAPVYVYEMGDLVGLIMPVRMKDGEEK